jgi:glutamate-1-semialdehyde 2,1-aminomutase
MRTLNRTFTKSEQLLDRALETIPVGTQTFSKSKTQFPRGVSPYFIVRGEGSRVWDVDGNEYIDLINALASVTLGYNDPEVLAAVKSQLELGTIFSLPSPIEIEVAETLKRLVPCAEMVRFGKNGSDATTGSIRVARAYTGRDRIAVCGYHGWHDWYIGTTARNLGVPEAVRNLSHTWTYNDVESLRNVLKSHKGEFAAIILEPMNSTNPASGFLENVQTLAKEEGALLIFDETITGFRFAKGGAQEVFGVTPDLATFGKGLANGYPLSALVGRREVMQVMESIFYSFTFGGETLSLAAARATLKKLQELPVLEEIAHRGSLLKSGIESLVARHHIHDFVKVSGHPSWSFVVFNDYAGYSQWQLKTLFLQEMFARGILTLGTNNVSYALSEEDVQTVLSAYNDVFAILKQAIESNQLPSRLRCEALQPLFKIR